MLVLLSKSEIKKTPVYKWVLLLFLNCGRMYSGGESTRYKNINKKGTSMKYRVTVTVNVPYPVVKVYDQDCTSVSAAVGRSLRNLRRDIPRKRIDEYLIKARPLQHAL